MVAMIKLSSNDNKVFTVPRDVAKISLTVATLLTDLGLDDEDEEESAKWDPIPLPNVSSAILEKVLKWCEYHKDDAPAVEINENSAKRTDDVPEWDKEFLQVEQCELFDLILAANYLDINGLIDVGCKTVAGMIKGKKPDEIRKEFDIENDFTPEEEEQIKKENAWCEQ